MTGEADSSSENSSDSDRPLRVVLIDDHSMLLKQLTMLLSSAGIEVIGTSLSLAEGHRAVLELAPDAVVLDNQLPDGLGIDLCRELLAEVPGLHVVIHVGTVSDEQVDQALAAGADAVIPKSIRGDALLEALLAHRPRGRDTRRDSGQDGGSRDGRRGNGARAGDGARSDDGPQGASSPHLR